MNHPEGLSLALLLAAKSDVVIENFSPRVMANWGFSYPRLREIKPDIIMVSMSAMGQTGPWRDYTAYAPTIHALSGFTDLTSFSRDNPVGPGFSYADIVAGLYAAFAVLASLENRERTGRGQYIDLSEFEAFCTLLGPSLLDVQANGRDIPPQGNRPDYVTASPYGCYRCSGEDRWCVIVVSTEEDWQALRRVIGCPAWTGEERFATPAGRREHSAEIDVLIETWTSNHCAEDIVQLLQESGIAAGIVQDAADLAGDPHLAERRFLLPLEHPVWGRSVCDRSPLRFSRDDTGHWRAAPMPDEDNEHVFLELLGLSEEEYSRCVREGVIA